MIYQVIAKRQPHRPNVILFYDEDREEAIKFLKQYRQQYGYSIKDRMGTFTVADLILREKTYTGDTISDMSYAEIFDINGNRTERTVENES